MKKERYDLHVEFCVKGGHQYEFPHKDAAQLNFSNYSNIVPVSFVMYCDLKAMITKEVNRGKIQNITFLFYLLGCNSPVLAFLVNCSFINKKVVFAI